LGQAQQTPRGCVVPALNVGSNRRPVLLTHPGRVFDPSQRGLRSADRGVGVTGGLARIAAVGHQRAVVVDAGIDPAAMREAPEEIAPRFAKLARPGNAGSSTRSCSPVIGL
jgi:hypothetical protein